MCKKPSEMSLKPETYLQGRYQIEEELGSGGYGITYVGNDMEAKRKVAIKECFLFNVCRRNEAGRKVLVDVKDYKVFEEAKQRFKEEADLLKNNSDNPGIIQVYHVFEENNTVYYVMEFLDGCDLKHYLADHGGKLSWDETQKILEPVFTALISLHRFNIWHRDISPDNIFICKDGQVRLIDFGSARVGMLGKSHVLDAAKAGYAPLEQYNDKWEQGTWTDVYAMAATVYRCITGVVPPSAPKRMREDEYQSPSQYAEDIPEFVDEALEKALAVLPEDRFKTMAEMKCALFEDNKTLPLMDRIVVEENEVPQNNRGYCPRIFGLDGYYKGKEFVLDKELYIGRKEDICHIVFPQYMPGVSGTHCKIRWDENKKKCIVHDLHSTYGTRDLGGRLIEKGVEVAFGEGEGFIVGDDNVFVVLCT